MNAESFCVDSFCIVPWVHTRLNHDGIVTPCCRYDGAPTGDLSEKSLEEIWNDEPLKDLRAKFLAGEKPKACHDCYRCEANGQKSLRKTMNSMHADEVTKLEATPDREKLNGSHFRSVDLRFSNLCNFRCRSCGPHNSVSWYRDAKRINLETPVKTLKVVESEEGFQTLVETILPHLRLVYFAGGEPMLDERHYRFLDRLVEAGKTDVTLDYNTNFSTLKLKHWDVVELWKKFDSVSIGASLDGVGKQGEILRKGMSWDQTLENYRRLMSEKPSTNFFVYLTVSAMNAYDVPDYFEEFRRLGMLKAKKDIQLNIVNGPEYICLGILNDEERANLAAKYRSFVEKVDGVWEAELVEHLETELRAVLAMIPDRVLEAERDLFRKYTFALDLLRKDRTAAAFPALRGIVEESDATLRI